MKPDKMEVLLCLLGQGDSKVINNVVPSHICPGFIRRLVFVGRQGQIMLMIRALMLNLVEANYGP